MRSKDTLIHKKQMIDGVKVGFLTQREVDNSNGKFYFDELTALEERCQLLKMFYHILGAATLSWLELSK
jgi:hypothetical protein